MSTRALVGFGLVALGLICALVALGTWQVERRSWKLDLIARVDARVHAPETDIPEAGHWTDVTPGADEYRRVRVQGVFLTGRDTLVQASTRLGPGYWVMTPLRTDDGAVVLVNRGFVPSEQRDISPPPSGSVRIDGLLRLTEPNGGFLRVNDPAAGRWYSRDLAAIASARGLEHSAPFFIDADAAKEPGVLPIGGLTVVAFTNNHLVYAATWFGLAILVVGFYSALSREWWRARRSGAQADGSRSGGFTSARSARPH